MTIWELEERYRNHTDDRPPVGSDSELPEHDPVTETLR